MTVINMVDVVNGWARSVQVVSSDEKSAAREYLLLERYLKALAELRAIAAATEVHSVKGDIADIIDMAEHDGPKEIVWTEAIEAKWGSGSYAK